MVMLHDDERNQDSVKGKAGKALRDYAYLFTTNQNFDHLCWDDVVNDKPAMCALAWFFLFWLAGAPWIIWFPGLAFAIVRWGWRAYQFAPIHREDGARHIILVFTGNGFLHRAEYRRGKGEVVEVLTDAHGPVPQDASMSIIAAAAGVDWGDEDTDDQPRQLTRALKTYKRRPHSWLPVTVYPRTSVGFVAHVLGIHDVNIRSPRQLMDYCERDGVEEEKVQEQLQVA